MKYEKPFLVSFSVPCEIWGAGDSPVTPGEPGLDDDPIEF